MPLVLAGATSGSTTIQATDAVTQTITLPNATGTIALTASPTFTGQATIPTINLTGGQIAFPATQNPSSDANTLDDYEEGTWTPTITASSGSPTYTSRTGKYIKIGNLITIYANVQYDKNTLSGALKLESLPFTLPGYPVRGVGFDWYNPGGSTFVNTMCYGISSSTQVQLFANTVASFDGTGRQYIAADLSSTGNQIYVTLTYTNN